MEKESENHKVCEPFGLGLTATWFHILFHSQRPSYKWLSRFENLQSFSRVWSRPEVSQVAWSHPEDNTLAHWKKRTFLFIYNVKKSCIYLNCNKERIGVLLSVMKKSVVPSSCYICLMVKVPGGGGCIALASFISGLSASCDVLQFMWAWLSEQGSQKISVIKVILGNNSRSMAELVTSDITLPQNLKIMNKTICNMNFVMGQIVSSSPNSSPIHMLKS